MCLLVSYTRFSMYSKTSPIWTAWDQGVPVTKKCPYLRTFHNSLKPKVASFVKRVEMYVSHDTALLSGREISTGGHMTLIFFSTLPNIAHHRLSHVKKLCNSPQRLSLTGNNLRAERAQPSRTMRTIFRVYIYIYIYYTGNAIPQFLATNAHNFAHVKGTAGCAIYTAFSEPQGSSRYALALTPP